MYSDRGFTMSEGLLSENVFVKRKHDTTDNISNI